MRRYYKVRRKFYGDRDFLIYVEVDGILQNFKRYFSERWHWSSYDSMEELRDHFLIESVEEITEEESKNIQLMWELSR